MTDTSLFVPSAPVWALVRHKQAWWGYSDSQMCDFLDWHPEVVDTRGLMLRTTAERILRRLAEPRRGNAVSSALAVRLERQETTQMQAACRSAAKEGAA